MLTLETGADNPVLRKKSVPIPRVDAKTRKLIKQMTKAITKENGVGLAAPQVGHNIRLVLIRLNSGKENEVLIPLVNPEITHFSKEKEWAEEGCLSLPSLWGQVERSKHITLKFQNQKGDSLTLKLDNLNARIVQHETDHLDGILFTDKAKDVYEKTLEDKIAA